MKKLIAITLVALLTSAATSCGKKTEEVEPTLLQVLDPKVEPMFNELKLYLVLNGIKVESMRQVSVSFVSEFPPEADKFPTMARCYHVKKLIVISEKYWRDANEYAKRAYLAHEVGHCAFKIMGHDENSPIMTTLLPHLMDKQEYDFRMRGFILELKKRGY